MEKDIFGVKRKAIKHKDRKAFAIFLLKFLKNQNKPISLGDIFLRVMPNSGIEYMREVLDELVEKKYVNKKDEAGESVPGFPYLQTRNITFTISIDGIDYLSRRSPIKFATNIITNNIKVTISLSTIIGIIIYLLSLYNKKSNIEQIKKDPVDSIEIIKPK